MKTNHQRGFVAPTDTNPEFKPGRLARLGSGLAWAGGETDWDPNRGKVGRAHQLAGIKKAISAANRRDAKFHIKLQLEES